MNNPNLNFPNFNDPNLNIANLGIYGPNRIENLTNYCLHTIMIYFDSPARRAEMGIQEVPSALVVNNCARCLRVINPQLINAMLHGYSINPRTSRLLNQAGAEIRQLIQTQHLVPQNQPVEPQPVRPDLQDSSSLDAFVSLQGQFCIGSMKVLLGPKAQFKGFLGGTKTSTSLNFEVSFDQLNIGEQSGVKGSVSLRRNSVEATVAVGTDLSRNHQQRSFTIQTKIPNCVNVGLHVKDDFPPNVHLLSPSSIANNGCLQVSHYFKANRVEGDTTFAVLPFQTTKNKVGGQNTDKNQLEGQLEGQVDGAGPARRAARRTRAYAQQTQPCPVHYGPRGPRGPGSVVDTGLFILLVTLFSLFFIFVHWLLFHLIAKARIKREYQQPTSRTVKKTSLPTLLFSLFLKEMKETCLILIFLNFLLLLFLLFF